MQIIDIQERDYNNHMKKQSCFKQNNDEPFMLWIKTFINIKRSKKKDRVIENNLLHEHSLFLRGCFRVQRNLFSYL